MNTDLRDAEHAPGQVDQLNHDEIKLRPEQRLFFSLLWATGALVLVELFNLQGAFSERASPQTRWLSSIYSVAPLTTIGVSLAFVAERLFLLLRWGRARVPAPPHPRLLTLGSNLLTLTALCLLTLGIASNLTQERTDGQLMALLVWLIPLGISSLYLRRLFLFILQKIYQRIGAKRSRVALLSGLLLSALIFIFFIPSTLWDRLLSWPFLILPLGATFAGAGLLFSESLRQSSPVIAPIRRLSLLFAYLGIVATVDLSERYELYPEMQRVLMEQTLLASGVIRGLRPFYDQDGDGYAGRLGGRDCDDLRAEVHPLAKEIPHNGIDEDCDGQDLVDDLPTPRVARSAPQLTSSTPKNIILITIDTLRADHLHYRGYERQLSENIDELALRGLNFEWAFSTGAQTRMSMPTVFIGKYVSEIARSANGWAKIHPENITVAERLSAIGYHTVGFPCHNYFGRNYGLNQGFKEWDMTLINSYQDTIAQRITGGELTDRVLLWFDQYAARADAAPQSPFFMWVHYFDPHHNYRDHPEQNYGTKAIDRYDEEIWYTDQQIGRLLDRIDALQLRDETYIILHSDHGEGFGDHGYTLHGQQLFNDQIHVPLLISGPGLSPRNIRTPVSLIDIVPTILELTGSGAALRDANYHLRGQSLLPFRFTERAAHPPVFSEMLENESTNHSARKVIIDWPWKFHYGISTGAMELYELGADPNEEIDRYATYAERGDELRARILRWMTREIKPILPYDL